jgi:MFS transporter, ACS family, pantothenate transporter
VTAGNRAAAVVAGFNVIVFTVIALLAHRERLQKKRSNQHSSVMSGESSETASAKSEAEVEGPAEAQKVALEVRVEIRNA